MTNHLYPARPDPSQVSDNLLSNPIEGQFWYNTSNKHMYVWNQFEWVPIMNREDYAANWGQVANGQRIPRPISADGYIFEYDECIWTTSPAVLGKFDNFICYADAEGVVTAKYRPSGGSVYVDGIANYLIIGIRGNHNRGVIVAPPIPSPTPTVTPTQGASATPTPTVSTSAPLVSPSPTATLTPTIGASSTPSPTPTRTPMATPSVTPSVTPSSSGLPPLVVAISDPEGLTDASSLTSYCDLSNYTSTNRDSGYSGCSATTITTCTSGTCSPEPGDNGLGPVMRIMVSGGLAPYTVKLKNFNYSTYYAIPNADFELGDVNWTKQSGWSITNTGLAFGGTWSAKFNGGSPSNLISDPKPVVSGRTVTASARIYLSTTTLPSLAIIQLYWYDQSMNLITYTNGSPLTSPVAGTWQVYTVVGTAPTNAKFVAVCINANKSIGQGTIYADSFQWDLGNSGTPECFFVGGASVPSIPYSGTVKTYSIAASGQTTPIITLNGICGSNKFSMSGNFDIEVTDSAGNMSTITKRWEIYRTGYPPSSGGGGGCVVSDAFIYQLGKASSVSANDSIVTYNAISKDFETNVITYAQAKTMDCVKVITKSGISLSCSTTAPLSLVDGTQIFAPDTLHKDILVYSNNEILADTVVEILDIGKREVMHISCNDNYFMASDINDGRFILHHNKQAPPSDTTTL